MKPLNRKLNRARRTASLTVFAVILLQAAASARAASVPYALELANAPPDHLKQPQIIQPSANSLPAGIDLAAAPPAGSARNPERSSTADQVPAPNDLDLNQALKTNPKRYRSAGYGHNSSPAGSEGDGKRLAPTPTVSRANGDQPTSHRTATAAAPSAVENFFAGHTDSPHARRDSNDTDWTGHQLHAQFPTMLWLIGAGMIGLTLIARRRSNVGHHAKSA